MSVDKKVRKINFYFPGYKILEVFSFVITLVFILNPVIKSVFRLITDIDVVLLWREYNRFALVLGVIILVLYALRLMFDHKLKIAIADNKKNPVFIFFGIFCLLMIVSTLINGVDELTLLGEPYRAEGLLGYLSYIVYFLLMVFCINERKKRLWLNIFVISSALIAVFQIIDEVFLNKLFNVSKKDIVFSQFNHYGYYVMMSLMAFILLFA